MQLEEPVGGLCQANIKVVATVGEEACSSFGVRVDIPDKSFLIPAGLRWRAGFSER